MFILLLSSNNGASSNSNSEKSFPNCKFKFGTFYGRVPGFDYSVVDYIALWLGDLKFKEGITDMLELCVNYNKTPVVYAYFIAFMSRDMWGLQDCNVGVPSLCQLGAAYVRTYRQLIISNYNNYSAKIANIIGKDREMIWLIEPDFWQYYGRSEQINGTLNGTYMRELFDDMASTIKSNLPNAIIAWNISPWLSNESMTTYWEFFKTSPYINFAYTSGGFSTPYTTIRPHQQTWAFMRSLTNLSVISDTGYGVAGNSTGYNPSWDDYTNLTERIKNGVISITQADPIIDWGNTLTVLRHILPDLC